MRTRAVLGTVALVIGIAALLAGNELTALAMALVVASQVYTEWDTRRQAARTAAAGEEPPQAPPR